MTNKTLRNLLHGKSKLVGVSNNSNPVYSLHQFFLEHPIPSKNAGEESLRQFYDSLHKINDAYLPEEQRKVRLILIVEIGKYSGIINTNKGARL